MQSFFNEYGGQLVTKSIEHLYISFAALFLGIVVAVPLGVLLTRFPKAASIVIGVTSALQTVPSLALLALMIPILGVGKVPAIVALFIYSLLPILRNTYIGMKKVDWATLASYIGAGGLGDLIFSGLNNYQPALIFAGTIPVTIFALLADWLLGLLENKLTPAALKGDA